MKLLGVFLGLEATTEARAGARTLEAKPGSPPALAFNCFSLQRTPCGSRVINLQVRRTTPLSQEMLQLIKNVGGDALCCGF